MICEECRQVQKKATHLEEYRDRMLCWGCIGERENSAYKAQIRDATKEKDTAFMHLQEMVRECGGFTDDCQGALEEFILAVVEHNKVCGG